MVMRTSPESYFQSKMENPQVQYAPQVKYEYAPYQENQYQSDIVKGIMIGATLITIGVILGAILVYYSKGD